MTMPTCWDDLPRTCPETCPERAFTTCPQMSGQPRAFPQVRPALGSVGAGSGQHTTQPAPTDPHRRWGQAECRG